MSMNQKLADIIAPYTSEPIHVGDPVGLLNLTRKVIEDQQAQIDRLTQSQEEGE